MVQLMAINGKWNGGDQNGMEMELWPLPKNGNCPFPFCPEHCNEHCFTLKFSINSTNLFPSFFIPINRWNLSFVSRYAKKISFITESFTRIVNRDLYRFVDRVRKNSPERSELWSTRELNERKLYCIVCISYIYVRFVEWLARCLVLAFGAFLSW